MVAPGGPDDETWKKMTPRDRRIYWILIAVVFSIVGYTVLFKVVLA
jgi:type II secretory pathway component PulM